MLSSRLPGKVLVDIGGKTMLEWVLARVCRAKRVNEVVVATTLDHSDDPVLDLCQVRGILVSRGSVHDVLDRYYQTAKAIKADVIIRITADCPLIDPDLIDNAVDIFLGKAELPPHQDDRATPQYDFIANRLPPPWGRTFPIGLDLEVFTFNFMEQAWISASAKHQREHVTPYFYEGVPPYQLKYKGPGLSLMSTTTPDGHKIALIHNVMDYGHLRWTVDTPEDLDFVRAIVSHLPGDAFSWKEVLALVQRKPELNQINAHVKHKNQLDVDDRG